MYHWEWQILPKSGGFKGLCPKVPSFLFLQRPIPAPTPSLQGPTRGLDTRFRDCFWPPQHSQVEGWSWLSHGCLHSSLPLPGCCSKAPPPNQSWVRMKSHTGSGYWLFTSIGPGLGRDMDQEPHLDPTGRWRVCMTPTTAQVLQLDSFSCQPVWEGAEPWGKRRARVHCGKKMDRLSKRATVPRPLVLPSLVSVTSKNKLFGLRVLCPYFAVDLLHAQSPFKKNLMPVILGRCWGGGTSRLHTSFKSFFKRIFWKKTFQKR